MKQAAANKEAAAKSKDGQMRLVVWVFDQGREVVDTEQARMYAAFYTVEAVFLNGVQLAALCEVA
jgi:hypothetical protein